mmetsp:Transcript_38087/g.118399  ORF Transcript_38087/g.118399 Transcript_38087/m.118399 type:complete len:217 (+) Transcript_38087:1064-1714(+)
MMGGRALAHSPTASTSCEMLGVGTTPNRSSLGRGVGGSGGGSVMTPQRVPSRPAWANEPCRCCSPRARGQPPSASPPLPLTPSRIVSWRAFQQQAWRTKLGKGSAAGTAPGASGSLSTMPRSMRACTRSRLAVRRAARATACGHCGRISRFERLALSSGSKAPSGASQTWPASIGRAAKKSTYWAYSAADSLLKRTRVGETSQWYPCHLCNCNRTA